jgi:hypothetical protein
MDEAVEAQTEDRLVTSEAGWVFQEWMKLWRLDRGLAPNSIGGWLGVPRMYEVVEAQTEAWLVTLSEAGWMFQGWMKLWRLRQRPGS